MATSNTPLVSLIIRTKNEEKWITHCLNSVFSQKYPSIEVILVDNCSTDRTVEKASAFDITVINIEKFLPGKAINAGIRASRGEYIVCLSGHCIPTSPDWLDSLLAGFIDDSVAGVYGRQEPLSYTSDLDKRDLLTVFGLDPKLQVKDSFFHNANSCIRRSVWDEYPFDEHATNIEDRIWGETVIANGFKLYYSPDASVYHWHGINHGLNPERAKNIVKILESLDTFKSPNYSPPLSDHSVSVIIPLKSKSRTINGEQLIQYTIACALNSKNVDHIFVVSDHKDVAEIFPRGNDKVHLLLRPSSLSDEFISTFDVLSYAYNQIIGNEYQPDLLVLLDETYPFRPANIIDKMLQELLTSGNDSVIAVRPQRGCSWIKIDDEFKQFNEGVMPTSLRDSVTYSSMTGLCTITHSSCIQRQNILSSKLGLHQIDDPFAQIQLNNTVSDKHASALLEAWSSMQKT